MSTPGINRRVACGYCGCTRRGRVSHTGHPKPVPDGGGCCAADTRLPADRRFTSRNKGRLPGWKPLAPLAADHEPKPQIHVAPAPEEAPAAVELPTPANLPDEVAEKWAKVEVALASGNPNKLSGAVFRYNKAARAAGLPTTTIGEVRRGAAAA